MEAAQMAVELARHDERIQDLEEWKVRQNETLEGIWKELKKLRDDFGTRPTWGVTVLVSILATACGSMGVFILTTL